MKLTPGRHINLLCKEHGITRVIRPGRGHAKVEKRWIQHPPIREEMAYFVALHEIGHIMVGLQDSRLQREAAAWAWALENSIVRPHYSTRQRITALLVRYIARAQANGWKIPADGELFWRLLAWWVPYPERRTNGS
jgi:hypothetical protein